ncbi:hypothetical protein VB773_00145 [Haloarculaceae archaeon H-GB2-1]|nr:hypothetical protein [Haloarculaceae archaeon H-GB1-1]MEA5406142.1 hypothetical protein [Haloarculaceae archaeon H-GB2-1]
MEGFLIQVSGHPIKEEAKPEYIEGPKGTRFCDEPLRHGEYFNASPYWSREGFGRRDAWETITPGDEGLLYCTGSVDEHGASLSHLLTVGDVSRDNVEGARLEFSTMQELIPKMPYDDIRNDIEAGRLFDQMGYCGQEGFNITRIPASDIQRIRDLCSPRDDVEPTSTDHPNDSLRTIAEDYFADSTEE